MREIDIQIDRERFFAERERERERETESFGKGVIFSPTYVDFFIKFLL